MGWTVAWWGLIFGRWSAAVRGVRAVAEVLMLAVSERRALDASTLVSDVTGVSGSVEVDGCGMPVRAVQISAMGGSGSLHRTVKRGLSQRL